MTWGIGYTLVNGEYYMLCAQPNERVVDWTLYYDEEQAKVAARAAAAKRHVKYIGEVR